MTDALNDPTRLPVFGGDDDPDATRVGPMRRPSAHALAGRIGPRADSQPVAQAPAQAVPWVTASRTPASPPPAPPAAPRRTLRTDRTGSAPIDFTQVRILRERASEQLSARLSNELTVDPEIEREIGRDIISTLISDQVAEQISAGETTWDQAQQMAMAEAVFDALFGLGRLQRLVDDDTNENIIITGHKRVFVEKTDGELVSTDPVADTDDELIDLLTFVASRSRANARSFSPASPRLHMRLDDGSRLAAAAWVTARPSVVIRRHRLREVTLADLVAREMLSPLQASLLTAAVKARKSIVVAGPQGAGKTTLVRALCAAIPPHEAIGTFETEYELHLHELEDQHPIVHPWEERTGSGEIGADGRPAGTFTMAEALYDSFRFNLSRQIVGEVRGREIWAMIKAMESGTGSISTTHAANAEAALRKLVTCAMEDGPHITDSLATMKLAETIDLVVQVHLETTPTGPDTWRRSRWVSEIVHVTPGESAKGYATTHVFRRNPAGGPGVPGILPDELGELDQFGFDHAGFSAATRTGVTR